jgi:hypothetical protein
LCDIGEPNGPIGIGPDHSATDRSRSEQTGLRHSQQEFVPVFHPSHDFQRTFFGQCRSDLLHGHSIAGEKAWTSRNAKLGNIATFDIDGGHSGDGGKKRREFVLRDISQLDRTGGVREQAVGGDRNTAGFIFAP